MKRGVMPDGAWICGLLLLVLAGMAVGQSKQEPVAAWRI
jgi:hypothetical protein